MKLYLMRHGQAASPQVDPQRGLTSAGRHEVEQLARRLQARGIHFEQVFHSEKARAQQTAEIMSGILAPEVTPRVHKGMRPDDDPSLLWPEIESWQQDTLIASHLPFVPNLLITLTGQPPGVAMVPGTIICLQKDSDDWRIAWLESP